MESTCASTYMPVVVYSPQAYVPKVILILYLISSYLHFTTSYFLISYTICPSPLLSCPRCFFFVSPPPLYFLTFLLQTNPSFSSFRVTKNIQKLLQSILFLWGGPPLPHQKGSSFLVPPLYHPSMENASFF